MMQPRDFDLVVVGRWHRILLADDDDIQRQLRAYIRSSAGLRDDQTLVRADMRRRMFMQAKSVRAAGGTHQYFCLELTPGLPFPASFTVLWPLLRFEAGAREASAEDFAAWVESLKDDLEETLVVDGAQGPIVRRHGSSKGPALGIDGMTEVEIMRADFWVNVPKTADVALFSFSCPVVADPEFILNFFTVIMCTLTWVDETAATQETS